LRELGLWTFILDGRRVKFTYQELMEERAFITAQVEGNKVVLVVKKLKVISRASF
jgi:hypothetical protein